MMVVSMLMAVLVFVWTSIISFGNIISLAKQLYINILMSLTSMA